MVFILVRSVPARGFGTCSLGKASTKWNHFVTSFLVYMLEEILARLVELFANSKQIRYIIYRSGC